MHLFVTVALDHVPKEVWAGMCKLFEAKIECIENLCFQ